MVVYILDKFVCMLLITVITTQSLQMAGVVESPKGLDEITYEDVSTNALMTLVKKEFHKSCLFSEQSQIHKINVWIMIPICLLTVVFRQEIIFFCYFLNHKSTALNSLFSGLFP